MTDDLDLSGFSLMDLFRSEADGQVAPPGLRRTPGPGRGTTRTPRPPHLESLMRAAHSLEGGRADRRPRRGGPGRPRAGGRLRRRPARRILTIRPADVDVLLRAVDLLGHGLALLPEDGAASLAGPRMKGCIASTVLESLEGVLRGGLEVAGEAHGTPHPNPPPQGGRGPDGPKGPVRGEAIPLAADVLRPDPSPLRPDPIPLPPTAGAAEGRGRSRRRITGTIAPSPDGRRRRAESGPGRGREPVEADGPGGRVAGPVPAAPAVRRRPGRASGPGRGRWSMTLQEA